jgi:hypothetical protein
MRLHWMTIALICAALAGVLASPEPAQARGLRRAPPWFVHASRLTRFDPRDWRFGDDRDFYCFLGEES